MSPLWSSVSPAATADAILLAGSTTDWASIMRFPRFRLRTLLVSIAVLALFLTVIKQTLLLQRARVREELFRAQAEHQRAKAARQRAQVDANLQRIRAAVGETPRQLDE
jgi:hypothetical protein